jgi:hypothetical protein
MSDKKIWFITGASRAAGDAQAAIGEQDLDLLVGGPRRFRVLCGLRCVESLDGWMQPGT